MLSIQHLVAMKLIDRFEERMDVLDTVWREYNYYEVRYKTNETPSRKYPNSQRTNGLTYKKNGNGRRYGCGY